MSNRRQPQASEAPRPHFHPCSCCSMSRRSFLGAAAACTAALTTGCSSLQSLHTTPKPNEEIDLAAFRPRPKVRVMSVIARQKPPYWLGWPGTSYNLEGERARYTQAIADGGRRIGVEIAQETQPLEDKEAVAAFVHALPAVKNKVPASTFKPAPMGPPPGDAKPGDAKPADPKSVSTKPGDAKPADPKSASTKPGDAKPAPHKPGDAL